ncbi:uncharacterized protein LOC119986217 [Tripterygium wilfordii]|nr:uncharacterized protein LOC119986217 [Tripterygium wilfordii]
MKQSLLQWSPCQQPHYLCSAPSSSPLLSLLIPPTKLTRFPLILANLDSTISTTTGDTQRQLSARERRQLRNEIREQKAKYNWREEVEERLMKKPKKEYVPKSVELNLDNLAHLGPQWWIIRVSRVKGHETADLVARLLARNYPEMEFKVYAPAIQEKRKLKNGSYSVKQKPIFPGCVFLRCVLNREIHYFIRECDGVGGFVGFKVGNNKRQISKPKPVSVEDMSAIFRESMEAKERYEQAFLQEQQREERLKSEKLDINGAQKSTVDSKPKQQSGVSSDPPADSPSPRKKRNSLVVGSTVRVVSGIFAEFVGTLKKQNRKTKKATVALTLFGKESLVDLDLSQIVAEAT